ncbi:MAG: long-chain fatty acid--CoA ligase [SAR324 cluster bacterium]|uniref:Long-chain fatty acid--CoA ligase n=1 Tax=SAR324 cluster bacterium TaxID=2024889 RepID=A0A2A4STV8_9DELT|nr:MAG: long-chain fatty acid--CoA ligase [SAR324 cluster bacterium]
MTQAVTYQDKPWLQHYEQAVPASIDYYEQSLSEQLEQSAAKFPKRMALSFQGYEVNYQQLLTMVNRFANCLQNLGVHKGDSVSILLPNLIPCVVAYHAALKIGAIVVMNNPLYSDPELEHQFNDSNSKILITLDLLMKRMVALRSKTKIKKIIYTSIGDYLPFPKSILFPLVAKKKGLAAAVTPTKGVYKWKDLLKKFSANFKKQPSSLNDLAMYQYTGGTTGVSKGVMLSHRNLSYQTQQLDAWFSSFASGGNEVMLGALPFFHVFGLSCSMNLAISAGWGNILIPKPQPAELLEAIRKFHPTFAPLVPTMFIGMLNHPDIEKTDLTSIKGCFSGSAPLPVEVIKEFSQKTGSTISEGFGLTESTPVTHINPMKGKCKIGSIGLPLPDTDCRIVDLETGEREIPVGAVGELIIRGPQVMQGYLNRPEETAETLRDGWLYTGDIARMDEEGYFFIVDRKKDMVICSGFNVYPRDIDEVLFQNHSIEEACCIGIPHPTRGEQVKAFVVLKEGKKLTEKEVIDFCKDKLAVYKLPTQVEFRKELPKSNVGKILRKDLREQELQAKKA